MTTAPIYSVRYTSYQHTYTRTDGSENTIPIWTAEIVKRPPGKRARVIDRISAERGQDGPHCEAADDQCRLLNEAFALGQANPLANRGVAKGAPPP